MYAVYRKRKWKKLKPKYIVNYGLITILIGHIVRQRGDQAELLQSGMSLSFVTLVYGILEVSWWSMDTGGRMARDV
ncbi:hypothetical protein ACS0TY_004416 [Phlomoides rotata]